MVDVITGESAAKVAGYQKLLNYLLVSSGYVSLTEIMEIFNISRRTAFNWLTSLNRKLQRQHLDKVLNVSRYGYTLTDQTKRILKQQQVLSNAMGVHFSPEQRQTLIIWLLLNNPNGVSINQLVHRCSCSRNTIINDFKILKSRFPKLQIVSTHQGHQIQGSERSIRLAIYELLQNNDIILHKCIKQLNYSFPKFQKQLTACQSALQINFSENALQQLTYLLMFTNWRWQQGNRLSDESGQSWLAQNTRGVLAACHQLLSNLFQAAVTCNEVVFFSKVMLCAQATEVSCVSPELYKQLKQIAREIIFRYEQLTGNQILDQHFVKVLCNHLYATYSRVKFQLPFVSDEIVAIQKNYPQLLNLTTIACTPLEQFLKQELPKNEVALICLYFGPQNNHDYQALPVQTTDKYQSASLAEVLVVCSSGIGTSVMLYHELIQAYPLIKFSVPLRIAELTKIFDTNYQAKLIISTAPLNGTFYPIPILNVKAILTEHDRSQINSYLRVQLPQKIEHNSNAVNQLLTIINEYADVKDEAGLRSSLDKFILPKNDWPVTDTLPSLASLLPVQHIKLLHHQCNMQWQAVLQVGCQLLEREQIINSLYFADIINLINKYGPYMLIADHVFLAHAAPSSHSQAVGLALVVLDQPIKICAQQQTASVSCLFVLSPGKNHEHEKALTELIDVVKNRHFIESLLAAQTKQEVRNILF